MTKYSPKCWYSDKYCVPFNMLGFGKIWIPPCTPPFHQLIDGFSIPNQTFGAPPLMETLSVSSNNVGSTAVNIQAWRTTRGPFYQLTWIEKSTTWHPAYYILVQVIMKCTSKERFAFHPGFPRPFCTPEIFLISIGTTSDVAPHIMSAFLSWDTSCKT